MLIAKRNTIVIAIAVLLAAESAWAQGYRPSISGRKGKASADAKIPNDLKTQFQGTGTIQAVAAGGMEVSAAGAIWLVKLDKNCKVEVTGTADPSFLRPGLLIRFTAEVDKKGKLAAPLNELEIVSPQNAMVFAKARAAAATKAAAGAAEDGEMPEATGMVGRITAVKNNAITIETGGGSIQGTLGPNPAIKVNANDYTLAQQGDKVDVKGWYVQPPDAMAQDVKITLSTPLGANPKKTAVKTAEKTAAK